QDPFPESVSASNPFYEAVGVKLQSLCWQLHAFVSKLDKSSVLLSPDRNATVIGHAERLQNI
ncbi:MAG: hypothetical protein OXF79_03270, partial [Chloroflexi bacterium]|nr:hypothetical protein [Chloroflexota bacterium]